MQVLELQACSKAKNVVYMLRATLFSKTEMSCLKDRLYILCTYIFKVFLLTPIHLSFPNVALVMNYQGTSDYNREHGPNMNRNYGGPLG